jgi:hypothetical protein
MQYRRVLVMAAVVHWAASGDASANERHFTFTYESAVLPRGEREIELWTTPRIGREDYFVRFDQRAEFEVGVTDRLQTALYLNFKSVSAETTPGVMDTQFDFAGVSSEWKYLLIAPATAGFGLALYGEVTGATDELELEGKVIADRWVGDVLLAANLVTEVEWELGPDDATREVILEVDLGATWAVSRAFHLGLELRSHNELPQGEGLEHSALFAGPVASYAADGWWAALTVMPQLPALYKHDGDGLLDLEEHERFNARLLFAFHL